MSPPFFPCFAGSEGLPWWGCTGRMWVCPFSHMPFGGWRVPPGRLVGQVALLRAKPGWGSCVTCSHMSPLHRGPCHHAHRACVCLSLKGQSPRPPSGTLSKRLWSPWGWVGNEDRFPRWGDPSSWDRPLLSQQCAPNKWLRSDAAQGPCARGRHKASNLLLDSFRCLMQSRHASPGARAPLATLC